MFAEVADLSKENEWQRQDSRKIRKLYVKCLQKLKNIPISYPAVHVCQKFK